MARTLTAARAEVAPERLEEYLAAVHELAAIVQRRGDHFWLFRGRADATTFLEFHESGAPRGASPDQSSAEERAVRQRLRSLAEYAPDAEALWDEVRI